MKWFSSSVARVTPSRRRMAAAGALAIALVGGTAVTTSERARSAVADALADPAALLAGRSPGERVAGALTNKKGKRLPVGRVAGAPPFIPTERVLSGGRFPATPPIVVPPPFPVGPVLASAPRGGLADGFFPVGGGGFFPGVGGLFPGGDGINPPGPPGPPPGPPGPPVPPTPPVPTPVPEPATWLTMILGSAALGGVLRLRRRRNRAVVDVRPAS